MRTILLTIAIALTGVFGYQYAGHGEIDMGEIFARIGCANGIETGDVIEHITGNFNGYVLSCSPYTITVDLGNGTHNWRYTEVRNSTDGR